MEYIIRMQIVKNIFIWWKKEYFLTKNKYIFKIKKVKQYIDLLQYWLNKNINYHYYIFKAYDYIRFYNKEDALLFKLSKFYIK